MNVSKSCFAAEALSVFIFDSEKCCYNLQRYLKLEISELSYVRKTGFGCMEQEILFPLGLLPQVCFAAALWPSQLDG